MKKQIFTLVLLLLFSYAMYSQDGFFLKLSYYSLTKQDINIEECKTYYNKNNDSILIRTDSLYYFSYANESYSLLINTPHLKNTVNCNKYITNLYPSDTIYVNIYLTPYSSDNNLYCLCEDAIGTREWIYPHEKSLRIFFQNLFRIRNTNGIEFLKSSPFSRFDDGIIYKIE